MMRGQPGSSRRRPLVRGAAWVLAAAAWSAARADLPPGFDERVVVDGLNQAVGITFAPDGRGFLWEKAGVVRVLENGQVLPTPLIDISDEVGNWRDLGLVGLCLDPDFANNGHIYLWYVVDYYHLMHSGERRTTSSIPSTPRAGWCWWGGGSATGRR